MRSQRHFARWRQCGLLPVERGTVEHVAGKKVGSIEGVRLWEKLCSDRRSRRDAEGKRRRFDYQDTQEEADCYEEHI